MILESNKSVTHIQNPLIRLQLILAIKTEKMFKILGKLTCDVAS